MSHLTSQSIQSNFIFTASTLFGIFPFRVIEKELKVNNYLLIYSLIISISITVVRIFFIFAEIYHQEIFIIHTVGYFDLFISLFSYIWQSFLCVSVFVSFYFYRNELVEAVATLDTLEPIFGGLAGRVKEVPIQKRFLLEPLVVPLVCCIALYAWGNTSGNVGLTVAYTSELIFTTLCCWQFKCFSDTVSEFFQSSSEFLIQIKPNPFKSVASLEKLIYAIEQLVATWDKINAIYSKTLFFIIINYYIRMLLHIYYIYGNISSNDRCQHSHIRGNVMMFLLHVYVMLRLIYSATQANYKSNEFNSLLYRLMLDDKTNKIADNSKLMLHISMQREVEFSVCGFFNLDYTLLHSMIASVTTYLIILIQFGYTGYKGHPPPTTDGSTT
ncbi:Gustatory receptor 57 [Halyomorpha halys]|nr:Gustatory receptor 57 [Halyomorpha halys]